MGRSMDMLVGTFTFLGIEFQNWMPLVAGGLTATIVGIYLWDTRSSHN